MRGAGVPPRANACVVSGQGANSRANLKAPARADCSEFTDLMRISRDFHSPWATAPTDDDRFAALPGRRSAPRF